MVEKTYGRGRDGGLPSASGPWLTLKRATTLACARAVAWEADAVGARATPRPGRNAQSSVVLPMKDQRPSNNTMSATGKAEKSAGSRDKGAQVDHHK